MIIDKTVRGQAGFGLVEVLIAAVVVAVGLLSVAALQSRLSVQSSDSKARAEAIAIAQARIENLRNYTNEIGSRQEFDEAFAPMADFGNDTTVDGVNATFTRSEAVGDVGAAKQVQVRVAWTDAAGVGRDVRMATRLTFESPRAAGDIAKSSVPTKISGPTGRARIGEGLVPADVSLDPAGDDGTQIWDDGSGDLKLVVDGRVVLTLLEACQVDELDGDTCLDFVKINGRVYIDKDTQKRLEPGEVHVIASDASYCQRYYIEDGSTVVVNDATTSAATTANGDYEHFDYRCYVGGGWYGNIGILLSGGISQSDKVCQGDPTVDGETWKEPRIGARRAYRGMLYRRDASTDSGWTENAYGDPVLYTVGVGDGVELPDPSYREWTAGERYLEGQIVVYDNYAYRARADHSDVHVNPYEDSGNWLAIGAHGTHDFVIASLPTQHTAGSDCIEDGVLVRTDATVGGVSGELFAGMPNDFVCLNPDHTDAFSADYSAPTRCPYPPTNGPALRHVVSGVIVLDGTTELAASITLQTSDGAGTCTWGNYVPVAGMGAVDFLGSYSCDVYEWGDGWNGFVTIRTDSYQLLCWDEGADGKRNERLELSGVVSDDSDNDFECKDGNWSLIKGTVTTASANDGLSGATISSTGGSCTIAPDGHSYECRTGLHSGSWSGAIMFTTDDGSVCGPGVDVASGTLSLTGIGPGPHEQNIAIAAKNRTCPL